jgi:hypothetical protein
MEAKEQNGSAPMKFPIDSDSRLMEGCPAPPLRPRLSLSALSALELSTLPIVDVVHGLLTILLASIAVENEVHAIRVDEL